jgi:hypothetical protein
VLDPERVKQVDCLLVPSAATPASESLPPSAPPAPDVEERTPVLKLLFVESSWVEIHRQDATDPFVGLQRAGVEMSFALDQPLTIMVAKAGGVLLMVDGQPGKSLGTSQESRTFVIDRQNYRTFLR